MACVAAPCQQYKAPEGGKDSHGSAVFLFEVVMPSLWSELHH